MTDPTAGEAAQIVVQVSPANGVHRFGYKSACRSAAALHFGKFHQLACMPTPAFVYQDPLPLAGDDTEYRLLSKEGISAATFEGREILKVDPETIAYVTQQAFHDTSFMLRTKHLQQVAAILGSIVVIWYVSTNYDSLKRAAGK